MNQSFSHPYKRWWMLAGVPIVVFLATVIGTPHTVLDLILYQKIGLNLFIGLAVWWWYYRVILWFDQKMPWEQVNDFQRWWRQFLLSVPLALLIDFAGIILRNKLLHSTYSAHLYFYTDLPVFLLLSFGIQFFYQQWYLGRKKKISQIVSESDIPSSSKQPAHIPSIAIKKGKETILISQEEIAYCYRKDQINFLRTFDGVEYLPDQSLSQMEKQLDESIFFRINRQLLVNRNSIRSFEVQENRQTTFTLQPPLETHLTGMNKNRAALFKQWFS